MIYLAPGIAVLVVLLLLALAWFVEDVWDRWRP